MERSVLPEYSAQILQPDEKVAFAEQMRGMMSTNAWATYAELLKRARILTRESFETAEDADIPFLRGLLAGLKAAESIPVDIASQGDEASEREDAALRERRRRELLQSAGGYDTSF
jgi:hypothetical protein